MKLSYTVLMCILITLPYSKKQAVKTLANLAIELNLPNFFANIPGYVRDHEVCGLNL